MAVAQEQHIGSRSAQEDALTIVYERDGDTSGDLLLLVADGMGGHVGGATASNLAIKAFRSAFLSQAPTRPPKERLQEALNRANAALRQEVASTPTLKGMGTTLIAAWKHGDGLMWLSVGDSPLYLYRGGQLRRLNVDHSFFGELMGKVRQGRITLSEAKSHPKRNALLSALTGDDVRLVDLNNIGLQINDTIIAASDGLDTLGEEQLVQVLEAYHRASPGALCQKLINATIECNNPKQDNVSIIAYMHGAQDRTIMAKSKWTRSSMAQNIFGNWQVAALSFVGVLLVMSIAIMIALKVMSDRTPEVLAVPETSTQNAPSSAPAIEGADQKQSDEKPADPQGEEVQAPAEDQGTAPAPKQQDPATSGVAATLQEAPTDEAQSE